MAEKPKKVTVDREVRFTMPASLAERIETIEGRAIEEIARDAMVLFYEDGRRTGMQVHRMAVAWLPEIYSAMLSHFGQRGLSRWIRQLIYDELSKTERDLIPPPDWSDTDTVTKVRSKIVPNPGREGYIAPVMLPKQWHDRMCEKWPRQVSPKVKAMVQQELERLTGKKYPVQSTIREFLGRDE